MSEALPAKIDNAMDKPMVWCIVGAPLNSDWTRVPLGGVIYVDDLKKEIKKEFKHGLSSYDANQLIVQAQWRDKGRSTEKVTLEGSETIAKGLERLESNMAVDSLAVDRMDVDNMAPPSSTEEKVDLTILQRFGSEVLLSVQVRTKALEGPTQAHYFIPSIHPSVISPSFSASAQAWSTPLAVFQIIENMLKSTIEDQELPNTSKYVYNHPLLKDNIIPIGPSMEADMRYFRKKYRGEQAEKAFQFLKNSLVNKPFDLNRKIVGLIGVSGCGKTATVFEIGREHFFTYFIIPKEPFDAAYSNDVVTMNEDIRTLVKELPVESHFQSRESAINAIRQRKDLEDKVAYCIRSLLLARRVAWSLLRRRFKEKLTPIVWLYCQEIRKFGLFFMDVYRIISKLDINEFRSLESYTDNEFFRQTKHQQRFVVAIDECHRLTRQHCGVFLPRGKDLMDINGNITNDGIEFMNCYTQITDISEILQLSGKKSSSFRSIFPLVVQAFMKGGAQSLVLLGTNLELNNLIELDSMVAKQTEQCTLERIVEFYTFTPDDVISTLGYCLNCQGMTWMQLKEIGKDMEGRARFTMGFLENIARCSIELNSNTKFDILKKLKNKYEDIIVSSTAPISLQKLLCSLVYIPQSGSTSPMRPTSVFLSGHIINVLNLLQDMLIASIFSRGKMLFSSSDAVTFVQLGLFHLTKNELISDIYENYWNEDLDIIELEGNGRTVDEIISVISLFSRFKNINQAYMDEESAQEKILLQLQSDINKGQVNNSNISQNQKEFEIGNKFPITVYKSEGLLCTLAEPWARLALFKFFKEHHIDNSIYSDYLMNFISSPILTHAARGNILELMIMTNISEIWAGKSLKKILLKSGILTESKLPEWLTDSLQIKPFEGIQDQSSVVGRDDLVIKFLSGKENNYALLPSTFSGPDGICATSDESVFLFFASALSIKNKVKESKFIKNIKTTDPIMFYTKANGDQYNYPKDKKSKKFSVRARHEAVKLLAQSFKGLLRIHFHIPVVAGNVPLFEVVSVNGRCDILLNIDLNFAYQLCFFNSKEVALLRNLCSESN